MGFWDILFPNVEEYVDEKKGIKITRVGNFTSKEKIKPNMINSRPDDIEMIEDESRRSNKFIGKI